MGWLDNRGNITTNVHTIAEDSRFSAIPNIDAQDQIYHGANAFRFSEGRLHHQLQLSSGEYFASPQQPMVFGSAVLSDSHLYLFKPAVKNVAEVLAKIPLGTDLPNLSRVTIAVFNQHLYASMKQSPQTALIATKHRWCFAFWLRSLTAFGLWQALGKLSFYHRSNGSMET